MATSKFTVAAHQPAWRTGSGSSAAVMHDNACTAVKEACFRVVLGVQGHLAVQL